MKVAIVVHEGVELLDFAGPGEVFAAAGILERQPLFEVYTVSNTPGPIVSQRFLRVIPDYTPDNCPLPEILVIPGGTTQVLTQDPRFMAWVRGVAPQVRCILTVCTGAFVLAGLGLLDGLEATTWWGAIDHLRSAAPAARVREQRRWVDSGRMITTAGVSAGIDGALHVVARLYGVETALATARYMEYDKWDPSAGMVAAGQ